MRPTSSQRRSIPRLIGEIASPSFELLAVQEDRRRDPGVHGRAYRRALAATIALQRQGEEPSESALLRNGAPGPAAMRRLLSGTDLTAVPLVQLQRTVDAGLAAAPARLIVEARTQTVYGPDRFGTQHMRPPSRLEQLRREHFNGPLGAANTRGGISTAIVLAACEGLLLPTAAVPIAQGAYDPSTWPAAARGDALRLIVDRERLLGPLVTGPVQVAEAIIRILAIAQRIGQPSFELAGTPITGGRLELGTPVRAAGYSRYMGASLEAVRLLRESGLEVFMTLPDPARVPLAGADEGMSDRLCWELRTREAPVAALELLDPASGADHWTWLPQRMSATATRIGVLTVRARLEREDQRLTLVQAIDASGRRELFVSTIGVAGERELGRIATLTASELDRLRPDSPVELALERLLGSCYLQRNKRRRNAERSSLAGVIQAAFALSLLAEAA